MEDQYNERAVLRNREKQVLQAEEEFAAVVEVRRQREAFKAQVYKEGLEKYPTLKAFLNSASGQHAVHEGPGEPSTSYAPEVIRDVVRKHEHIRYVQSNLSSLSNFERADSTSH